MSRFTDHNPHTSAQKILSSAKHVQLKKPKILEIAQKLAEKAKNEPEFWRKSDHVVHPLQFKSTKLTQEERNAETAQYLFYITAINFSYWQNPTKNAQGETGIHSVFTVNGYKTTWGMVASVERALKSDEIKNLGGILSPKFHMEASTFVLKEIFEPDAYCPLIPMINKRIDNWREISKILLQKFDGQIYTLLKQADKSAVKFLNILLENFTCFRDESVVQVNGNAVTYGFYKRAQLLVADIWNHCNGTGLTDFHDIDQLSSFADYRVPQSLRALGCIEYDTELAEKIENYELIGQHSAMEIEIRAATVKACDEIAREANLIIGESLINSTIVDNYLWVYAKFRVKEEEMQPYHLTRCCNY